MSPPPLFSLGGPHVRKQKIYLEPPNLRKRPTHALQVTQQAGGACTGESERRLAGSNGQMCGWLAFRLCQNRGRVAAASATSQHLSVNPSARLTATGVGDHP